MIPPLVQIALLDSLCTSAGAAEKSSGEISFEDILRRDENLAIVPATAELASDTISSNESKMALDAQGFEDIADETEAFGSSELVVLGADELSKSVVIRAESGFPANSVDVIGLSDVDTVEKSDQAEDKKGEVCEQPVDDFDSNRHHQADTPEDTNPLISESSVERHSRSLVSRGTEVQEAPEAWTVPVNELPLARAIESKSPSSALSDISAAEAALTRQVGKEAPILAEAIGESPLRHVGLNMARNAVSETTAKNVLFNQIIANSQVQKTELQVGTNDEFAQKIASDFSLPTSEIEPERAPKEDIVALNKSAPKRADDIFIAEAPETQLAEEHRIQQLSAFESPLSVSRSFVAAQSVSATRIVLTLPQVEEMVQVAVQTGMDGKIEVELQPLDLGRMKLTFKQDQQGMTVIVEAEKPETVEQIKRHLEHLSSDLKPQGDIVPRFRFEGGSFGQSAREGQNPQQPVRKSRSKAFGNDMSDAATHANRLMNSEIVSGNLDIRV